jgi:hypothetical protein
MGERERQRGKRGGGERGEGVERERERNLLGDHSSVQSSQVVLYTENLFS